MAADKRGGCRGGGYLPIISFRPSPSAPPAPVSRRDLFLVKPWRLSVFQPLASCLIMFHLQSGHLQAPVGFKGLGGCTAGGWSREEKGPWALLPEMPSACCWWLFGPLVSARVGCLCSISEVEPLGCAWKSGEDREASVRGRTVLTVWGTRVESLFSDEGVAVRLAGPVVRAGSLLLSGGSGREQSRMQGACPGCSALGLWALGLLKP